MAVGRFAKYPCWGVKARIRHVGFLAGFSILELGKEYTIMEVGLNSNKRRDGIVFFYFILNSVLFGIYMSPPGVGLFCLVWVCDVFLLEGE